MIALGVHFFWRNNRFFTFIVALSLKVGHSSEFASCGKSREEKGKQSRYRGKKSGCSMPFAFW